MKSRWLTFALLGALLVSLISAVYVRHDARRAFMDLQNAHFDRDELAVEWGRLQLEYATASEGSRVEVVAREQLMLREPTPDQVQVIVQ